MFYLKSILEINIKSKFQIFNFIIKISPTNFYFSIIRNELFLKLVKQEYEDIDGNIIKTFDGKIVTIDYIGLSTTIKELKHLIELKYGIPPNNQILTSKRLMLSDDKTLLYHNLYNCIIYFGVRLKEHVNKECDKEAIEKIEKNN